MNKYDGMIREREWVDGRTEMREVVIAVKGHRLQMAMSVHLDHPERSSATIKRWSGERWERVASIPPQRMKSCAKEVAVRKMMDEDEKDLFQMAYAILGIGS